MVIKTIEQYGEAMKRVKIMTQAIDELNEAIVDYEESFGANDELSLYEILEDQEADC
jgi:hypothetical protein